MMLDGDKNQNNLEVTAVSVPEEGRQATGDKLHADAEGDDILVGRDGQEQQPHGPGRRLQGGIVECPPDVVCEAHCNALKHGVQGNGQHHQETPESSLGIMLSQPEGFEYFTSNPTSAPSFVGISWACPCPGCLSIWPSSPPVGRLLGLHLLMRT